MNSEKFRRVLNTFNNKYNVWMFKCLMFNIFILTVNKYIYNYQENKNKLVLLFCYLNIS